MTFDIAINLASIATLVRGARVLDNYITFNHTYNYFNYYVDYFHDMRSLSHEH
jgi:hypothetical protein